MGKFNDLTGKRFGMLVVIKPTEERCKNGEVKFLCKCDCGTEKFISGTPLLFGKTISCGCYNKKKSKLMIEELNSVHASEYSKKNIDKYSFKGTIVHSLTSKKAKNNTSGHKGIHFEKRRKKWMVYITLSKKRKHIGYFDDLDDAIKARKEAEEIYYKPVIEEFIEQVNSEEGLKYLRDLAEQEVVNRFTSGGELNG